VIALLLMAVTAEDPVRDDLRALDPPWYDRQADGWRRVVARKPDAERTMPETGDGFDASWIAWLLLAAILVVLVVGIVRLLVDARHEQTSPATSPERRPLRAAALADLPFPIEASDDPQAAADAAHAAGDWRRSLIWSYALMLLRLDAAGVIVLVPGITDRACLAQTRAAVAAGWPPSLETDLRAVQAAFERVCYGHAVAGEPDAASARSHLVALGAALGRR
jgi:hypothetical protein